MRLTQVFRTFLISDVLVTVASNFAGSQATDAVENHASVSLLYILVSIGVGFAWISALVGLWRFRNWARVVYLGLAGVGPLAHLLAGGGEATGLEEAINALSWLIRGMIIALAYWSPLASKFRPDVRAASQNTSQR